MIDYLLSVARESPPHPPTDQASPPSLTDVFRAISANPDGITRHGLDTMIDALFALPGYDDALCHPVEYQHEIANMMEIQQQPVAFQAQWTHIIVPAWNQHAELRKVIEGSRH
jgi:hypothetical protein